MLYMVVERFEDPDAVYRRLDEQGRMLPEGLEYRGSWVEPSVDRCFQLVECDDPALLDEWAAEWEDLVDFEFVPVVPGPEMEERVTRSAW